MKGEWKIRMRWIDDDGDEENGGKKCAKALKRDDYYLFYKIYTSKDRRRYK